MDEPLVAFPHDVSTMSQADEGCPGGHGQPQPHVPAPQVHLQVLLGENLQAKVTGAPETPDQDATE